MQERIDLDRTGMQERIDLDRTGMQEINNNTKQPA
jgi:hypothetical protein